MEYKINVEDHYETPSLIRKGSYSNVYKVQHKSSKLFRAMEIISKARLTIQDDDKKFLKELQILIGTTGHPNLVKILEYFTEDDTISSLQSL